MTTCSTDLSNCVDQVNQQNIGFSTAQGTEPWLTGPAKLVTETFSQAQAYADQSFNNAWCFLTALANTGGVLNDVVTNVQYTPADTSNIAFQKPVAPDPLALDLTFPVFPGPFEAGSIYTIDDNKIGDPPTDDSTPPVLRVIPAPDELDVTAPDNAPDIQTDFNYPDNPVYTLPSVPTLDELDISDPPTIINIPFTQTLPVFSIPVPGNIFSFVEDLYSSDLLTALKVELLDRVQNGGTGLNPTIEQAIWDRARNREDNNSVRSENQIDIEQAARGFSRPPGSHLAAIDQAAQDTQNKNADLSREIAIKQAELEQRNIEFALQTSLALEQSLIQYSNQVNQRAFEVEQFTQQVAIELYNAQVAAFNSQLEAYKAYSVAFEAQVRAQLNELEAYKLELEGESLRLQINQQDIDLYLAQLNGIKLTVDVFNSEIAAVNSQIAGESLKLENYGNEIQNYTAQVQAKRDEYAMFGESVKAEKLKTDIYATEIQAFVSRVQAYASTVDAETTRSETSIKTEDFRLRDYLSRIESITEQTKAKSAEINAQTQAFLGDIQRYSAETGAEESRIEGINTQTRLNITNQQSITDTALKNAQILIENARNSTDLTVEAIKSGASVSGGLAQAALAAMDVGANISGSSSDIHNYEET